MSVTAGMASHLQPATLTNKIKEAAPGQIAKGIEALDLVKGEDASQYLGLVEILKSLISKRMPLAMTTMRCFLKQLAMMMV